MESIISSYNLIDDDDDDDNGYNYFNPIYGVPAEKKLQIAYKAYELTPATTKLTSEANRSIHAEAFITNDNLGPLSDLCIRAIAKRFPPGELNPIVADDPYNMHVYYGSLSVNLPLEKCYFVTDKNYWRRVVLQKSYDKSLGYKKYFDWKPLAISLKLVQRIESCSAEYIPENIEKLIPLIKEYVTELKICHLQSLREFSFVPHFRHSDSESTNDTESSDFSHMSVEISEDSIETEWEENAAEIRAENELAEAEEIECGKNETELEWERKEAERELTRIEEKKALKKAKQTRREVREDRRRHRRDMRENALIMQQPPPPPPKKKPKRKSKNKFGRKQKGVDDSGVFNMQIAPEKEDSDINIRDRRNIEDFLGKIKKFKYAPQHCHHVNLTFLGSLDNLTNLHIEFLGPKGMRFENRHLNFSYIDIDNLALALCCLEKLKVFRLRNSRMDCRKVYILSQPLQYLPGLETVDFGYDQLKDDCGGAFYSILRNSNINSIELEGNFVGINVLGQIADALRRFSGKFKYLGLAQNPLGDKALHMLTEAIIGTQQLTHLCISGATVTQEAIACCIAHELLKQHPILIHLDMVSVHVGPHAANEIAKALQSNFTIRHYDCRVCDMPYDIEHDINVVLERNRYIVQNSFVGDESKTEDEIIEFVNREKNPIWLKAINKRDDRLKVRPDECFSSIELIEKREQKAEQLLWRASSESTDSVKSNSTFVYDSNNFDLEEFERHVYTPGTQRKFLPLKSVYATETHRKFQHVK